MGEVPLYADAKHLLMQAQEKAGLIEKRKGYVDNSTDSESGEDSDEEPL
jgi:hypothetical protein